MGMILVKGILLNGLRNLKKENGNIHEKKEGITSNVVKVIVSVFLITLFISAIVLTNSRMLLFILLLVLLIFCIIEFRRKQNKQVFAIILTGVAGIICSGYVETYIENMQYSRIYPAIALTTLITVCLMWLVKQERVQSRLSLMWRRIDMFLSRALKRAVFAKMLVGILVIVGIVLVLSVGKKLNISVNNESKVVTREITNFKYGNNDISFSIIGDEDSNYNIYVYYLDQEYNKNTLANFEKGDKASGKVNYLDTVWIPEGARKIAYEISVKTGEILVNQVNINRNIQKVSYMFLPDEIMFRLKGAISGEIGNSLRGEYIKDGIKLLKLSPIFGHGGEGFKFKYQTVQSVGYISSEAHSAITQTMVEAGMLGLVSLVFVTVLPVFMILKMIRLRKYSSYKDGSTLYLAIMCLVTLYMCFVDLTLSYAIMIYLLAIVIGLTVNKYRNFASGTLTEKTYKETKFNVQKQGYATTLVLSLLLVTLGYVTYFSYNAYRASLVKIPKADEDTSINEITQNVANLEYKNRLDKYDMDYMTALNKEYGKLKTELTSAYLGSDDKDTQNEIQGHITETIKKLKENTDRMLELGYNDKYVIAEVANTYFENFLNFTNTYIDDFSSKETAYLFYLSYSLKLTDRVLEISPKSDKSHQMVNEMYSNFKTELTKQNNILQSESVGYILEQIENKLEE